MGHLLVCCKEEVKEKERLLGSRHIDPGVHKKHKSEIAELLTKVCHLFFKLISVSEERK